tara:strand:+ start:11985 stop:12440 length:456 start_codon:yes stop_codon:yes gene_type:complete
MGKRKYGKENLTEVSKKVNSFSQMMEYFNISSGSARTNMIKRCVEYDVDTSHFIKSGDNLRDYDGQTKKDCYYYFSKKQRVHGYLLRRSLIEIGVEYVCVECGNDETWNGKNLTLQVDHIDGDNTNNDKNNLRFLCPNCHSQTDTWGYKKR